MPPSRTAHLAAKLMHSGHKSPEPHIDTPKLVQLHCSISSPVRHTPYKRGTLVRPPCSPSPNTPRITHDVKSSHEHRIMCVLECSLAKRTGANYASATRSSTKFCTENSFCALPASELALSAFAASLSSSMAGSSIANIFSGLKSWHNMHNKPWNAGPRLQMLICSGYSMAPPSSSWPQQPPVTTDMFAMLNKSLNRTVPVHVAVWAAAFVIYWTQCRLGEVLGSSKLVHDVLCFPSRSSLGPRFRIKGQELHLPSTKTHQIKGEKVIITVQCDPVDPISVLQVHIRHSQQIPDSAHLFAYIDQRRGDIHCLMKKTFLSRCNNIWVCNGFGHISGHAFRLGGTTGLLKAGVPPEVVQTMGRWGSDAHFRY